MSRSSQYAGSSCRSYALEILLVSFAALLLEISYTRVISFKLFYYYTYLVIGLALLGIGCGGVIVAISRRLRRADTESILRWGLLLGAASVGVGYLIVATIKTDTLALWEYGSLSSFTNLARLLAICLALFSSFIAVGVMIATLFARQSDQIGRLYFADLVGAGIACAVVVSFIGWIGPPATIFLAGLVLALAGLRLAVRDRSRAAALGAVLVAVLVVGVVRPSALPQQRADAFKGEFDESATRYSSWSPIFRVDVVDIGPDLRLLYHDGLVGSVIQRWDGKQASLSRFGFDTDPRALPFVVGGTSPENVLIVGAAGGHEILASLHFDAGHIDAVELNPVTHSLVTDEFADYAGHLAQNPAVKYVEGDGRSFLARSDDTYNLVWYPAPDSYSATNAATAGAYVLSESYLYTSERGQPRTPRRRRHPRRAVRRVRLRPQGEPDVPVRGDGAPCPRRARGPRPCPPHPGRDDAGRRRERIARHDPREARRVHDGRGRPLSHRLEQHAGLDAALRARASGGARIGERHRDAAR